MNNPAVYVWTFRFNSLGLLLLKCKSVFLRLLLYFKHGNTQDFTQDSSFSMLKTQQQWKKQTFVWLVFTMRPTAFFLSKMLNCFFKRSTFTLIPSRVSLDAKKKRKKVKKLLLLGILGKAEFGSRLCFFSRHSRWGHFMSRLLRPSLNYVFIFPSLWGHFSALC